MEFNKDWREVGKDEILPQGVEVRMNLSTGKNMVRISSIPNELNDLNKLLEEAVNNENYELAAVIRNKIIKNECK